MGSLSQSPPPVTLGLPRRARRDAVTAWGMCYGTVDDQGVANPRRTSAVVSYPGNHASRPWKPCCFDKAEQTRPCVASETSLTGTLGERAIASRIPDDEAGETTRGSVPAVLALSLLF